MRPAPLHRRATPGAIALALGACATAARADADADDAFERRVVRIACVVPGPDGKPRVAATGSGFLVGDRRHVVTNHHVALSRPCQEGQAMVMAGDAAVALKVLAHSEQHDLAVAEAERDVPGKAPVDAIVRAADLASRDEVYVLGFPGAVDEMAADDNRLRATTTRGIIGRKIRTAGQTGMLQVDARTIGGNSGGPWLDACGRLVGIHSRGVYKAIVQGAGGEQRVEQLPLGYGYAVQTDHLLPLLDAARVSYATAGRCSFAVQHADTLGWSAALLLGGGLALRYSPPGRRLWARLGERLAPAAPTVPQAPRGPHLAGLSGALRDLRVELGERPLVIGRDPRVSHLALPDGCDDVSKRHCRVRLAPEGDGFLLEDCWSLNGTFLASGERLAPGSTRRLPAGARFYLADARQMFELRDGSPAA